MVEFVCSVCIYCSERSVSESLCLTLSKLYACRLSAEQSLADALRSAQSENDEELVERVAVRLRAGH